MLANFCKRFDLGFYFNLSFLWWTYSYLSSYKLSIFKSSYQNGIKWRNFFCEHLCYCINRLNNFSSIVCRLCKKIEIFENLVWESYNCSYLLFVFNSRISYVFYSYWRYLARIYIHARVCNPLRTWKLYCNLWNSKTRLGYEDQRIWRLWISVFLIISVVPRRLVTHSWFEMDFLYWIRLCSIPRFNSIVLNLSRLKQI